MSKNINDILKNYWGYTDFRNNQEEIVKNILNKKDLLAIMATGGGKSICFQVPAILSKGLTIVISPLISLMQDQVIFLKEKGIKAEFLNSSLLSSEYKIILKNIKNLKLLYIAPEQLTSLRLQSSLKKISIERVIIDEAHCITEWGHDFRPEYKKISLNIRSIFPNIQICAFTATANKKTAEEIKNILELNEPFTLTSSFDRENLFLGIEKYYIPFNKKRRMKKIILESKKTLIYCSSRKETEYMSNFFSQKTKIKSYFYHAGMNSEERKIIQNDFKNSNITVLFATTAFGMGIDIPDIDTVIYWNFPSSIEEYYQGIGRAGRNKNIQAKTFLLYSSKDISEQKKLLKSENPSIQIIEKIKSDFNNLSKIQLIQKYKIKENIFNIIQSYLEFDKKEIHKKIIEIENIKINKLNFMINLAKEKNCKRKFILNFFDEITKDNCNNCSSCE